MTLEEFKEKTKGKQILIISDLKRLIENGEIETKILNIDLTSKSPEIGDLSTLKCAPITSMGGGEILSNLIELETTSEKEYAKELVAKIHSAMDEIDTYHTLFPFAKQIALIFIEEMKKHSERFNFSSYNFEESINSLLLVEKEIELL